MFTLPQSPGGTSTANAIFIDEEATHMEAFFDTLTRDAWDGEWSSMSVELRIVILSISTKFDFELVRIEAEKEVTGMLGCSSKDVLVLASWRQDIELGQKAIRRLKIFLDSYVEYELPFWTFCRNMRPEWQIELASLLLPKFKKDPHSVGDQGWLARSTPRCSLDDIADRFDPK